MVNLGVEGEVTANRHRAKLQRQILRSNKVVATQYFFFGFATQLKRSVQVVRQRFL